MYLLIRSGLTRLTETRRTQLCNDSHWAGLSCTVIYNKGHDKGDVYHNGASYEMIIFLFPQS